MLEITGLCKTYGDVVALDGVDLSDGRVQVVALLGPNGAAKSTLVSIVAGLHHPDEGAIRVTEWTRWPVRGRPGSSSGLLRRSRVSSPW